MTTEESVKNVWNISDTSDQVLGFYGADIFAGLCRGEALEDIAYDIHCDQEVRHGKKRFVPELQTAFELEFRRRFLQQTVIGQRIARMKELRGAQEQ